MSSSGRKGARFGFALLGAGIIFASGLPAPAVAQNRASTQMSAGDALSRNLRTLAENPRSLSALMGAGRASLEVGDAQAALTFFTRAEEIAPRDGRIKMWVASALVQVEQPRAAMGFFEQAVALGVPQADVAADRGLAHDMLGDPRLAQRDYELALRSGADPEVTRRLALSFAISGERERALALLEDQLLVRDRAAERTRAFILALTGDAAGAARAAESSMPGPQAAALAPFLARLPSLSLSERALAVHFGHFPGSGQPAPSATAGLYASRDAASAAAAAGAPDPRQPALGGRSEPVPATSTDARRRPDSGALAAAANPPRRPVQVTAQPVARSTQAPAVVKPAPREAEPAGSTTAGRLADVAATIASLSDAPVSGGARTASPPSRSASAGTAAARTRPGAAATAPAKKAAPPAPREPSRVWVQVAGGADKSALPREYGRLKAKAPRLLGSRSAWTTPANATNRLLVGPFPTTREAQAFVNELAKVDVAGFAWTSAAGQKVERLAAAR